MTQKTLLILVLVVGAGDWIMRFIPLALLRKPLTNPRLVEFVNALPYAILTAMVVPGAFSAAGSVAASAIALGVALALSLAGRSLPTVAAAATAAAYLAS